MLQLGLMVEAYGRGLTLDLSYTPVATLTLAVSNSHHSTHICLGGRGQWGNALIGA